MTCKATISPRLTRRQGLGWLLGAGFSLMLSPSALMAGRKKDILAKHRWLRPLLKDGYSREELSRLLGGVKLYRKAIRAMNNHYEALPYHRYRKIFLTEKRRIMGRDRYLKHGDLLQRIEAKYGVPPKILVALWGVESFYGQHMGVHPVLRVLFTLSTRYPRREHFFRAQLLEYLRLCKEEGWDPRKPKGSYAGAMSQVQMIPGTMRRYAVDFDGDGKRDVFGSVPDILASIAAFLKGHGWRKDGLYDMQVRSKRSLKPLVSRSLDKMRPISYWKAKGVHPVVPQGVKLSDREPAALIMLDGINKNRYRLVFRNFRVVTRWNNARRFAMMVGEFAGQLEEATQQKMAGH